jgi:hypothetical protein
VTNGLHTEKSPTKRIPLSADEVLNTPLMSARGVGRDVQQLRDDHHLQLRQTPARTSDLDTTQKIGTVLTDEEYVKPAGACEGCGGQAGRQD